MKKALTLLILSLFLACTSAPKPQASNDDDYFATAEKQRQEEIENKRESDQKRYDILNAFTVVFITMMLVK